MFIIEKLKYLYISARELNWSVQRINLKFLLRNFVTAFAEHFRVMCVLGVGGTATYPRSFLLTVTIRAFKTPDVLNFFGIFAEVALNIYSRPPRGSPHKFLLGCMSSSICQSSLSFLFKLVL